MQGSGARRAHAPTQLPPRQKPTPSDSLAGSHHATRRVVLAPTQPPERLLDRKLNSMSTFVSSGLDGGSSIGGLDEPEWSTMMPQALLFPDNKPTSRADAAMLDKWVVSALANYAQRVSTREELREEDLSMAVEELVPILSIGLHEVVRQVTQHCVERGVVLEKIWRTYVELFERALGETRAALRKHKEKTAKVEADLRRMEDELTELRGRNPRQLSKLSNTLTTKFSQHREELQDQLDTMRGENRLLQQHLETQASSIQAWFPNFDCYRNSDYRRRLWNTQKIPSASKVPEPAMAADYRRIFQTMEPDARRRIGFFVSSLLGLRSGLVAADSLEGLSQRRDHNKWKIGQLEERLASLKASSGGAGAGSDLAGQIQKRMSGDSLGDD